MNGAFYNKIEDIFTKSRLSVYRQDGVDGATALARYLYNIELCKSLYAVLNVFEISLRNSIDKALCLFTQNSTIGSMSLLICPVASIIASRH
ncbi:MAG: hypothetical protein IJ191_06950 [Treponema sp.]|nr:hypothetical protein [Treponema sp.]